MRWNNACATVTVVAETDQVAAAVLADAIDGACEPIAQDKSIPIAFWHRSCDGRARRNSRDLAAVHWPDIRVNYPVAAAQNLKRVMAVGPDDAIGRLLLLPRPARDWQDHGAASDRSHFADWCHAEVVVDSDRLYRGEPK